MTRIAITGPESSGKTKLAADLAAHYKINYVPEFAREYLLALDRPYTAEDLEKIADGQTTLIEKAKNLNPLIVDTEMVVMHTWSKVVFGKVSDGIQKKLAAQHFDLYLLCDTDIPWEYDPLRENEFDRNDLFQLYYKKLRELKYNFIIVKGTPEERLLQAVKAIEKVNATKVD